MERNYTRSWLVGLAVLLCGAAVARAQEPPPQRMLAEGPSLPRDQGPNINQAVQPLGPVDAGTVSDAQFFQQPDLTQIGNYPVENYGPYFQYERLYWSMRQPSTTQIGDAGAAVAAMTPNDNDTGFMGAGFVWGNRFDLGYVLDDNTGWAVSILKTNTQFNTLIDSFSTNVTFINNEPMVTVAGLGTPSTGAAVPPAFNAGRLSNPLMIPVYAQAFPSFNNLEVRNFTRMTGIELMKTYRYPVSHNGGVWSIGGGVRFFQLHDRFDAVGEAAPTITAGAIPAGVAGPIIAPATTPQYPATPAETEVTTYGAAPNSWDLGIDNDVVGPQIEVGYEMENNRWTVGTSFRAMFGANFQNASEYGYTGGPLTNTLTGFPTQTFGTTNQPLNNFFNKSSSVEFAPLGELRVDAEYKITDNVSLKVGYTAILITGIGRAADRIVYALPDMGILDGGNKQHFFADGVTFGFEINR
jgi:hypothetical protein